MRTKLFGSAFFLLGAIVFCLPHQAAAADCGGVTVCNCGDTVTSNTVLPADLLCTDPSLTDGLVVGANNITIDGNGHALIGQPVNPVRFDVTGILSQGYTGITIKNFSEMSNFAEGAINFQDTSNSTIENNVIVDNQIGIIFDSESLNNNVTGNTLELTNPYAAANLTDPSNTFHANRISLNVDDFTNVPANPTNYTDNLLFPNTRSSIMLSLNNVSRTVSVNQPISFEFLMSNLDGSSCADCTYTAVTSPSETVTTNQSGQTVDGSFTPSQIGTYSLIVTVTDSRGNVTTQNFPFFVASAGVPLATSTLRYYIRSTQPTFTQNGNGEDTGSLLLTPPTSIEDRWCGQWLEADPDEVPPNYLSLLSEVQTHVYYVSSSTDVLIGLNRISSYDIQEDHSFSTSTLPSLTFANNDFTNLNWTMDSPWNWYLFSIKTSGTNIEWQMSPSQPSYADFTYTFSTTPEIESNSNANLLILSASASTTATTTATIVVDNQNASATTTTIVVPNIHRPFMNATSTIDATGTTTLLVSLPSDATSSLATVPMDVVPSTGSVDLDVNNWTGSPYSEQWTEGGSTHSINTIHTIGDLKPSRQYEVKVDGSVFGTYTTNSSGQLSFTYTGGYSDHAFELDYDDQLLAPILTTSSAESITSTAAALEASVTDDGGADILTRGFVYGTSTAYGATTTESGSFGDGSFSANLSGLLCDTVYYFAAYAVNSGATGYGPDRTFITPNCSSLGSGSWTQQTAAGQLSWYGIASSVNGLKLAAIDGTPGYIYTSVDGGDTWVPQTDAGTQDWEAITSSADGTKLAAAVYPGYIWTSTDSGVHWTEQTSSGNRDWVSIASSADGSTLIAADGAPGYIYVSTDGGTDWTPETAPGSQSWVSVTSSSDGLFLAAAASGNYIWTSSDGGADWTEQTSAGNRGWNSLTSSSDGSHLFAATINGDPDYVWESSDYGADWVQQTNAESDEISYIASSGDGESLVGFTNNGSVWISTDGGENYTEQSDPPGEHSWVGLAASGDGSTFIVGDGSPGYLYTYAHVLLASPSLPSVSISSPTSITTTGVTLNGSITSDGNASSTVRGFVYGTSTSYGATTTESGTFGIGDFSADAAGLSCGTTYHYAAYATNSEGTGYSSDETFATSACPTPPPTTSSVTSTAGSSIGAFPITTALLNASIPGCPLGFTCVPSPTGVLPTVTQSLNSPAVSALRTFLYPGTKGSSVSVLQQFLIDEGYLNISKPTGLFGPLTEAAVMTFQLKQGIIADASSPGAGNVGPKTLGAINATLSNSNSVAPASAAPDTASFARSLSLGQSGPDVKALQIFLNANGYPIARSGPGSSGEETAYFGPATQAALIKFQEANGIAGTGFFGALTRAAVKNIAGD